jgi:membrane associated rhomboid family serine protease
MTFVHILFNMLGLLFFGPRLEVEMGNRDFLLLYFMSGIAGALLSCITPYVAIVGASGAVYGILLAYARFWPRDKLLIWGVVPIEARYLIVIMTVLSIFGGISGTGNIAHFAHLGGFLGGYLYLKFREWRMPSRRFKEKFAPPPLNRHDRAVAKDRPFDNARSQPQSSTGSGEDQGQRCRVFPDAEQAFLDRFSGL